MSNMDRWVVKVEGDLVWFSKDAAQRAEEYAAQCRSHGKLAYVMSEEEHVNQFWDKLAAQYEEILKESE